VIFGRYEPLLRRRTDASIEVIGRSRARRSVEGSFMLSLWKVPRGRESYYLSAAAGENPNRPGLVEHDGEWLGWGARHLGLARSVVEGRSLSLVLGGVDPETGEILDASHHRVHVVAFDCMFAAPKSVSLLYALGPSSAARNIETAHRNSVGAVLGYLERNGARVRRTRSGARVVVKASGLTGASFLHRTSRALDPHLHSHLLVANLGEDQGNTWSALDARGLYLHARAAGALYGAHLRYELSCSLGIRWQLRPGGFADVAGLPRDVLLAFSQRTTAIERELELPGRTRGRSARIAAARTRPQRSLDRSYEELVEAWRERAFSKGVSMSQIDRLITRRGEPHDEGRDVAPGDFADYDRPLRRDEAIRVLCSSLAQGAPVLSVEREIEEMVASGELVRAPKVFASRLQPRSGRPFPAGDETLRYISPQGARRTEALRRIVSIARDLTSADVAIPLAQFATKEHRGLDPGLFVLRNPIGELLRTYEVTCGVARDASRARRQVVGVAPTKSAAAHLEATTGVLSTTPEHFAIAKRESLVIVDKADRLSVGALRAVIGRAAYLDASVVFIARLRGAPTRIFGRGPNACSVDEDARLPYVRSDRRAHFAMTCPSGVSVVLTEVLPEAFEALKEERDAITSNGGHAVIVTADHDFAHLIGECAVAVSDLRSVLAKDPKTTLVVLGGARVLGAYLHGLSDEQRVHVSLRRIGGEHNDREFATEIAEPEDLRRSCGRVPLGLEDRRVWRAGLGFGGTDEYFRQIAPSSNSGRSFPLRAASGSFGRVGAEL
jgi:conjugative relaxase-like TrwC/TraI family protein